MSIGGLPDVKLKKEQFKTTFRGVTGKGCHWIVHNMLSNGNTYISLPNECVDEVVALMKASGLEVE